MINGRINLLFIGLQGLVSCLLDCMNGRIGLLFIGLHEWKDRSPVYWIA